MAVAVAWHRPAATALIRPLAWEPPYATGAAQKKTKKKKRSYQNSEFLYIKGHHQKTKTKNTVRKMKSAFDSLLVE